MVHPDDFDDDFEDEFDDELGDEEQADLDERERAVR